MSEASSKTRPEPVEEAPAAGSADGADFAGVARTAAQRVRSDSRVRRNLPGEGRLEIDRTLPFLFVYRHAPGVLDSGTEQLVTGFSAYLLVEAEERFEEGLAAVVGSVVEAAVGELGDFLLFEVWTGPGEEGGGESEPSLEVVVEPEAPAVLTDALEGALRELRIVSRTAGSLGCPPVLESFGVREGTVAPPEMSPVPTAGKGGGDRVHRVGLEVSPFFRHPGTGEPYPRVLHAFRQGLVDAVEDAIFAFAQERTSLDPPHPRALARRTVGRATRHVDRRLGEVARSFDTILQVTPLNTEEAWEIFRDGGCDEPPSLRYRPLHFDPESIKRRLFHVPIEKVEDPLLGFLLREKQEELDRQITMLREIETDRFRYASVQLYGGVDRPLLALAREVLEALPPASADRGREEYPEEEGTSARYVDAEEFAAEARREIGWYRRQAPSFEAGVEIRSDVTAGLMVTGGVLCVGRSLRVPRERVEALIHHEVGTHLVTWCNGAEQSIQQFQSGLAGYDSLQEGLAVLSEYLVDGLTTARMRVLAGRVVGVQSMLDGAGFMDTYRLLAEEHGFPARTAFIVTVRIHRGGGLTKDAAYLRGLRDLLDYLGKDGALDPLFVGKLGLSHTEIVQELVLRGVLALPMVKPRYVSDLAAMERLGACRHMGVMDLVERISAPSS